MPVILPETAELREEADGLARELARAARYEDATILSWLIDAQVALLRDLSRPASMDAARRRLARRFCVHTGGGLTWRCVEVSGDVVWQLEPDDAARGAVWFHSADTRPHPVPERVRVLHIRIDGLDRITDPARAMRYVLARTEGWQVLPDGIVMVTFPQSPPEPP